MRPADAWRILIVAQDAAPAGDARALCDRVDAGAEVRVVAPALGTRLEFWTSDTDPGHAEARRSLGSWLEALRGCGLRADGRVGDSDPLVAIEDELAEFDPDEVIISQRRDGPHWTEQRLRRRRLVPAPGGRN